MLRLVADRREEVLDNVVLPVTYLPVSFYFLFLVVAILDIQSSIVGEIPESHLIETF